MPKFSGVSLDRLTTCDADLQIVFQEVIRTWDFTITCGYRNAAEQNLAFRRGLSKKKYPDSLHNIYPSKAIDVAPFPLDWGDLGSFYMFAGYVLRVAYTRGIKLRYGGDWDGDRKTADQKFNDLGHFELIG